VCGPSNAAIDFQFRVNYVFAFAIFSSLDALIADYCAAFDWLGEPPATMPIALHFSSAFRLCCPPRR